MDPTAFTLPVNAVAQFWKKLVFFDAVYSWQICVSCSFSICLADAYLFYLFHVFFFFETEVNLDVNLPSFFFFFFKLEIPLNISASSEFSPVFPEFKPAAKSFEVTAESVLSILGCRTKVAESMDIIQVLGSLLQLEMIPVWFGVYLF